MTNCVLLTLGRLPVGLDLARSFAAGGWRVLVADPFGWHLSRMSNAVDQTFKVTAPAHDAARYLADLKQIIDTEAVDLLLPVSEETLYVAELVDAIDPATRVFAAAQSRLLQLHDKLRFARLLAELNLPAPQSHPIGTEDARVLAQTVRTVSKPRFSSAGRKIGFHKPGDLLPADAALLLQERIEGREVSALALARRGELLGFALYEPLVTDGHVAVCFRSIIDEFGIREQARTLIAQQQHTGFMGLDLIVREDGTAMAIECNPRATSGLHFFPTGELAAAISLGEALSEPPVGLELTEAWSCYTAVLAALPNLRESGRRFRALRRARDITWSRDDPRPFLLMGLNSAPLIATALHHRCGFAAAAVLDIEWQGTP